MVVPESDGSERLGRALAELVASGALDEGQARQVQEAYGRQPGAAGADAQPTASARIPEVLGYLGGAFVVAAVLLVLAWSWDDFGYGTRVAIAVVGAVVTLAAGTVLALAVAGGSATVRAPGQAVRRRLAGVLLVAGTWVAAGATALVVDHADVAHELVWVGGVGLVLGVVSVRLAPGVVPTLGLFVATVVVVLALQEVFSDLADLVWFLAFLVLGVLWVAAGPALTRTGQTALAVGLGTLVATAWVAAAHEEYIGDDRAAGEGAIVPVGVTVLVVVAVVGVGLYLRGRSWPWMAAGTVAAVALVVELTGDAFGPAVAALVAGVVLLAASGLLLVRRGRPDPAAATPPGP